MTITFVTGIAAVVLGTAYTYQAFIMPRAPMGEPTAPMIFPAILGVFMTILGAVLIVQEEMKRKETPKDEVRKVSLSLTVYGRSIAIVAFMCLIYVLLFERIGYVFSTFLFLATVLHFFNGLVKWKTTLVVSVSFSVGVYFIFSVLMGISLPTTPLIGL